MQAESELRLLALPIRYSSWTVRPLVILEYFNIPYRVQWYNMSDTESLAQLHKDSPSGLVPVLLSPELVQPVHDSLAIAEFLHEKFHDKQLWPENLALRTYGRSIVAELHSGFSNIRSSLSHNFCVQYKPAPTFDAKVLKEVARILEIFDTARNLARKVLGDQDEGFLFGKFSIADAFYWPILSRFHTYSVDLSGASVEAESYVAKMWSEPVLKKIAHKQFEEAKNTSLNIAHYDNFITGAEMRFWDLDEVMKC